MTDDIQIRSHVTLYRRIWIAIICVLFVIRFGLMKGAGEDYVFNLYLAYMIPTWGGVMILNFYEGRRLMAYLRKNHHEYWIYLTSGMGFGPGIANSFRSLPFLFSDDDLNDPNVKQLKENYRQFVLMLFLVFFSIPIFFVIIMLPY